MSSFAFSGDTPLDEYLAETDSFYEARKSAEDLQELLQYPLQGKSELGTALSRFNGAVRVDVSRVAEPRIVRSPHKFLTILRLMEYEANVTPSYGLRVKKGSRYDFIHYVLDLNEHTSVGIFFYDSKRLLSVPQIHNVERMIKAANLKGGIIVANHVGIPAKQEAQRINNEHDGFGIITIEHYDSLEKRYQESKF